MSWSLFSKKLRSDDELQRETDNHLENIEKLLVNNDIHGAFKATHRFQKKFPHNKRGLGNSAIAFSNAGEVDTAIKVLTKLDQQNPNDVITFLNLAVCYSRVDQPQRALEFSREAFNIEPDRFETVYQLSESLFELDEIEEAKSICQKFALKNRDHALIWFRLGCYEMYFADHEQAVRHFERSLELDPDHFESLANLGAALVGTKEFDKAESIVLQTLEARPNDGVTICNLAQIYESRDMNKDAYDLYVRSTKVDPEYERAQDDVVRLREFLEIT